MLFVIVDSPDTVILPTPLTAPVKVAAPVTLYAPIPEIAAVFVVVAAVLLKLPIARAPPTIPPKLTAPVPAFKVKFLADPLLLSVLLNVILLLVVESVVNAEPSVTAFP